MTPLERAARAIADHPANWQDYVQQARAALMAIREPSEAQIDRFVSRALCVSVHGAGGWSEYGKGQWQTMIDAALDDRT